MLRKSIGLTLGLSLFAAIIAFPAYQAVNRKNTHNLTRIADGTPPPPLPKPTAVLSADGTPPPPLPKPTAFSDAVLA